MTWFTVGAAAIGAVGSIAGGAEAAGAAGDAANAQIQAAQIAQQTQLQMFGATAGLQTPGRNLGYSSMADLAQLFGMPNPNSNQTTAMYPANQALSAFSGIPGISSGGQGGYNPMSGAPGTNNGTNFGVLGPFGGLNLGPQTTQGGTGGMGGNMLGNYTGGPPSSMGPASQQFSNFYNSPGYQFTQSQGQQAVNRGAAAGGGLYTPNTSAALASFTEGTAANQYNNYVQQLMGLAGIGGSAIAGTQSAATTAGNNISQAQIGAGNANASGILGQGSAISGAINNTAGILGNALRTYNTPSNPNSISDIGAGGGYGTGTGSALNDPNFFSAP